MPDSKLPTTSSGRPVNPANQILIVEDEATFAKAVKRRLTRSGYLAEIAGDLATAMEKFKTLTPDIILLDMRLPDGSGLDFLAEINNTSNTPVVVMSAYGEMEDAVSAMKLGASDYLKKPIDLDELLINLEKVLDKKVLETKLIYSNKREQNVTETIDLIGECQSIKAIHRQIEQISQLSRKTDTIPPTVLILGETGTGKDLIAKLLHASSALCDRPFVQVDCAALPKDLIEAELFGHEKGAFTNAHKARIGLIEAAENGVLFMDEIGELPLDLQAKLLAVLERRIMRRVGTSREQSISAWFIAGTNRNIETLIKENRFRSDLYYRLNVLSIAMPPLRERGNDIILLAKHFADKTAHRYNFPKVSFTDEVTRSMLQYAWPGNVREMKHLIERAVLLSSGGELSLSSLTLETRPVAAVTNDASLPAMASVYRSHTDRQATDEITLESAERTLILQALKKTNGNVSKAARDLGVTRMSLRYRIKKYQL